VVTFTFGVANFFRSPILGALSDSFGRRPVPAADRFAASRSLLPHRSLDSLLMLVAVRLLAGHAGNCRRQRLRRRHHAARATGEALRLMGGMFGIGFILGR